MLNVILYNDAETNIGHIHLPSQSTAQKLDEVVLHSSSYIYIYRRRLSSTTKQLWGMMHMLQRLQDYYAHKIILMIFNNIKFDIKTSYSNLPHMFLPISILK